MADYTFQPAGVAFAAIVAGLAPAGTAAAPLAAPGQVVNAVRETSRAAGARETSPETAARETLSEAAARMGKTTPFGAGQLALPFED